MTAAPAPVPPYRVDRIGRNALPLVPIIDSRCHQVAGASTQELAERIVALLNADERRARIVERLNRYYSAQEIQIWLYSPHPQLGGKIAIDLIDQGRADEVLAILDRLDSGAYL